MKRKNLEQAVIMSLLLSGSFYATCYAQIDDTSTGITISEGTTSDKYVEDKVIGGVGLVGTQGEGNKEYNYTLDASGKITINKEQVGVNSSYSGIYITGGINSNFNATIKAGSIDINNNLAGDIGSNITSGIGINTGNNSASTTNKASVSIDLKSNIGDYAGKNISIKDFDRGIDLGNNTKLDIKAGAIKLEGKVDESNHKVSDSGIFQSATSSDSKDSEASLTANNNNIEITNYANGVKLNGTSNTTSLTANNGDIKIKTDRITVNETEQLSGSDGLSILMQLKDSNGNNSISLSGNNVEISGYKTGINIYTDDSESHNSIQVKANNTIKITDTGTGILNYGTDSNVKLESKYNYIQASDGIKDSQGKNTSGKGVMAQFGGTVDLISTSTQTGTNNGNQIVATVGAVEADNGSVNIIADNSENNISATGSIMNRKEPAVALNGESANILVQGNKNIISAGTSVDTGMFKNGIAINAIQDTGTKKATNVNIIATGDKASNAISGIIKASGNNTTVNIGGGNFYGKANNQLTGAYTNTIISAGTDGGTVAAVYAKENSTVNIKSLTDNVDSSNFIVSYRPTDIDNPPTDEKTIWVNNANVNISGYQNKISSGGEFKIQGQEYQFKNHYTGTAIEIDSTSSSIANITASHDNEISGAVTVSGVGATLKIENTAGSEGINNITSANLNSDIVSAINVKDNGAITLSGANSTNIIRAFVSEDITKLAATGITEKAIVANSGKVDITGANNIISAGSTKSIDEKDNIIFTDTYAGIAIEGTNASTTTVSASVNNVISGAVTASGNNTKIDISNTALDKGQNSIISANTDGQTVSAISVKDGSTINITGNNATNVIRAFVDQDNAKLATAGITEKAVVVDNGTFTLTGANNIISAGATKATSAEGTIFSDTYTGIALDVKSTATISASGQNIVSGSLLASGTSTNIKIENTASTEGINNISSANVDNNTVTAVSVKDSATVNITGSNTTNIIRAFVNQDNAKLATDGITEKAVVVNTGTFKLEGVDNIISAGSTKTTEGKDIKFIDTYKGVAIDSVKGQVNILGSNSNIISGSVKAEQNTTLNIGSNIKGTNTLEGNGSNQIISAQKDGDIIKALDVNQSTVKIKAGYGTDNKNYIKAAENPDGENSSTIQQKAISVNIGLASLDGYQNLVIAGNKGEGIALEAIRPDDVQEDNKRSTITLQANSNVISGALVTKGKDSSIIMLASPSITYNARDVGIGSNQIISTAVVDNVVTAVSAKDSSAITISAGLNTDNRNYIEASTTDGKQIKAILSESSTVNVKGYDNAIYAGKNAEGIAIDTTTGTNSQVKVEASKDNSLTGALISKGETNKIELIANGNKSVAGYSSDEVMNEGSNQIISSATVDIDSSKAIAAVVAEEKTNIKISAGTGSGQNYIKAENKNSGNGYVENAVVANTSNVDISSSANFIITGEDEKDGKGIALKATSSTINAAANVSNIVAGAIMADSSSTIDLGKKDLSTVTRDVAQLSRNTENHINSTYHYKESDKEYVLGVLAKGSSKVNMLGTTNTISATSDDNTEKRAVWADSSIVKIDGEKNQIVAGEKGEGLALNAISSTVNSTADKTNAIWGAVVATGTSNIDLAKNNATNVIAKEASNISRNESNQINSTYHYKESDKEYVLGVLAKDSSKVNMLGTTNTISATSDDNTEKRAVWADSSTVKIDGAKNQIVAGEKGEGLALNAINSTVNSTADTSNAI